MQLALRLLVERVRRGELLLSGLVLAALAGAAAIAATVVALAAALVRRGRALAEKERRATFLAEASRTLSEELGYEATLGKVARLVVPALADWCSFVAIDEKGLLRRVAVVHGDPRKRALAEDYASRFPPTTHQIAEAYPEAAAGRGSLKPVVSDGDLRAMAHSLDHLQTMRKLGICSSIVVPLHARGRVLGALSLLRGSSQPPYGEADLALAQEVADRAALAIDAARLLEQAKQEVRRREDLMAIVSHDLKNPLAGILTRANLLFDRPVPEGDDGSWVRGHADAMRRSAVRMSSLIDSLLDAERAAAGHLELALDRCPVEELLEEALSGFQGPAKERSLRFRVDVPRPDLAVRCDRGRALQILSNLVANAVKFSPPGGEVVAGAAQLASEVQLWVADSGPGVSAEDRPRLFDRYWHGSSGGTGLGLYIVKTLTEAHGGHAWVESEIERGSRFCVTLPVG
ncbi:MAG TPA: GAF domain-containing sensor histidine kinase [Myxococcales bacterium]|nr:GAF domain-containing sensor histidine kinase [Myxococcales bacterium]